MIERAAKMADWLRGAYGFSPEMNAKCVQLLKDMVEEMERLKAERDAAIADLKDALDRGDAASFCEFCRHNDDWGKCEHPCNPYSGETGWEWRGLPELPKEDT